MTEKYRILIICAAILFLIFVGTASAKTWHVDDDLQDFPGANFTNTLQDEGSSNITVNKKGNTMVVPYINNTLNTFPIDTTINSEHEFVPVELIVKFKPRVSVKPSVSTKGIATIGYRSIDTLNEQYGVTSLEKVFKTAKKPVAKEIPDLTNIYILKLPMDADIHSIAGAYKRNPNVEYAEPNYIAHICVKPNDPYYSQQWAHQNMQSEQAWDIEKGDSSVAIAIIDTGVDWDHPDLAANIWNNTDEILDGNDTDSNGYIDDIRGWDFVNNDNNPMDDNGHGTHCAGIASAVTNNSVGIAGVCWNCTIMPIKGLNSEGSGSNTNLSNAIIYAADNGADVISMSWGSYSSSNLLKDALNYTYNKSVVLVAAAGNYYPLGTCSKHYPAGYDNVIAVAATDSSDARASFSNWGSWIDVAAPGIEIYSTYWNDTYATLSGTSMSCPFVVGLTGLILSKTDFSQEEIRTILRSTTDDLSSNNYIGTGRMNAYKAVLRNSTPIASINSSLDDAFVRGTVNITGTANGIVFQNYSLYYGKGIYPTNWVLIHDSDTPVTDGILASWNISLISENGYYTIRLVVNDISSQISEDRVIVLVDNELLPYWPVNLGFWSRKPVIADLDLDGDKELIVGTGNGYLHILRHNGSYFWGQPVRIGCSVTSPAVADLNNDNTPEIIVAEITDFGDYFPNGRMHVFEPNGSYLDGWPITLDGGINGACSPSIADIDNDGGLEIIIGTGSSYSPGGGEPIIYYKKVYAFHHSGEIVDGWPVELSGTTIPRSTPVLVDLDGDNKLEIIMGSLNYTDVHGSMHALHAFHWNGTTVSGFPYYNDHWNWAVAAGDVNNDGEIEILTHGDMIDGSGNPIDGWTHQEYVISYLALADVNDDNYLEIVYGQGGTGKVMVVDHNGNPLDGWPQITQEGDIVDGNPVVGDIDGDGDVEILIGSYDTNNLYAWHHDGNVVDGFPKITTGHHRNLALADLLDNDGYIELISCDNDGYMYVWGLYNNYIFSTMEWPIFQHDSRHTGWYGFNYPPIAEFTYLVENKTVMFNATSSHDSDGTTVSYEWDFGDGTNGTGMIINHTYSSAGNYLVSLAVTDDDGATNTTSKTIKIPEKLIFDTGTGTYPSIFGTHNGTIKPNQTITVFTLYTYPCSGTGGHTEYAMIWNETMGECAVAEWNGYRGDYCNISFNKTLTLKKGVVYNYTIRTGSYPQIHHNKTLQTPNGWINCTQFTDANEKIHYDWIPAIRLWM